MKVNIEKIWYSKNIISIFLLPLSWIFIAVSSVRRILFEAFASKKNGLRDTQIIVVGNLTVGGAGKTPFVSYLAQCCLQKNISVGVVARGYGREDESKLEEVMHDSNVTKVGDEALMLKHQLGCPVAVAAKRIDAVKYLNKKYSLDLIISDDGLQHYKLPRDVEIIVVDGEREFGNGWCLPSGPLREPVSRLRQADIVVSNGENASYVYQYCLSYNDFISLDNSSIKKTHKDFEKQEIHAVAGIGYPRRFFAALEKLGLHIISHTFPDHHAYQLTDIEFNDNLPIIMTEKDAVKCRQFNLKNMWYLSTVAVPGKLLDDRITYLLEEIKS